MRYKGFTFLGLDYRHQNLERDCEIIKRVREKATIQIDNEIFHMETTVHFELIGVKGIVREEVEKMEIENFIGEQP